MANTVRLHRVIKAKVEHVYKAFTTKEAISKWIAPNNYMCAIDHLDIRVGGEFHMYFINIITGEKEGFGGKYTEVLENKKLVYSDKFDNEILEGELITTVVFNPSAFGTEIFISQEGIPEAIPVEMCYLGWQESLNLLTLLVEN